MAARPALAAPAPRPAYQGRPARLQAVPAVGTRRSVGAYGTFVAFLLFATLLALAGLHAVLVQNQADLDELVSANRARRIQIHALSGDIAILDSPEGIADQARGAGLVSAPEVVTLSPLIADMLASPGPDPFRLIAVGRAPGSVREEPG